MEGERRSFDRAFKVEAVRHDNGKQVLVSCDPNLGPPLWDDLRRAKKVTLEGLAYADVVKILPSLYTAFTMQGVLSFLSKNLVWKGDFS